MFKKPELFGRKKIKPDEITIEHTKEIPPAAVQSLYLSVGWQYRDVQDIEKACKKSVLVTTAWHDEFLIGIARATGDGVFNATIWDVAVKPSYQNQGIGRLIIKSMLTKLDDYGISLITLYTRNSKKNFYGKLGFESTDDKIIGMYRYTKKQEE